MPSLLLRPRGVLAFPALLLAVLSASPARAEHPTAALVRLLHSPGRPHPFADRTGRIPVTVALPPGADAAALGLLQVAPGVGAVRLAPEAFAAFSAAHPELRLAVAPPRRALLDVSGTWTQVEQFRQDTGMDGTGVLVGVVDTGLDVRHPDVRTADGHTRVAWLLGSGAPRGLHADLEDKFGCTDPKQTPCFVLAAADIDAIIQTSSDDLRDPDGHGTHVTSIAAGNGGPMVNPKPRFVGLAPGATLIIASPVQSGGFYDPDILNGARFLFDRADFMKKPLVANLSLGGDYGPHDGTSDLEKGLEAMVGDDKPGHVIVVAAGNSGDLVTGGPGQGPFGSHTEVHVWPGEVTRVPIAASAAKSAQGYVWITFQPGDDVDVGLEGPGGATWVGLTGRGERGGYSSGPKSSELTGVVVNNVVASDTSITADTNSAVVVFTGHWSQSDEFAVVLRGSGTAQLWLTAQGDAAGGGLLFERATRQGTINLPACAPNLLAVGCTINRVMWTPYDGQPLRLASLGPDDHPVGDSACYFSAAGPTPAGVQKPEISAPGGFVAAAMSKDADPRINPGGLFDQAGCPDAHPCAVMDDYHAIAAGTSMSSPHVAGAVALLLQLDPTLTQARVTEVLQAGARHPGGHVPDPNQLGPGELDLEGAKVALMADEMTPHDADPKRSWYTLSSEYARPDPTWPVWGTVELRYADGTPATGLDGTALALKVSGGTMIQPLTRVQRGLWRFALAGTAQDDGDVIDVDVTYDGVSFGQRSLPVGEDVWRAEDPSVSTIGGACACGAAGARGGGGGMGMAAVGGAVAMAAMRRRRRGRRRS